jgi:hypothetical protein
LPLPAGTPSTDTVTLTIDARSLIAQPPNTAEPLNGLLLEPGVSISIFMGLPEVQLATVKLEPMVI